MSIVKLTSEKRGLIQSHEFKGHLLFSLGQPGTARPDSFGTVYVFNDDYIYPDAYLGMHPHKETEIITIMLEGAESHADSLGNYQELNEGCVQLISSGTGIRHAGGNLSSQISSRHLQIWIAPNAVGTTPGLQLKLPDLNDKTGTWNLLVSPDGSGGSLIVRQNAWISEGAFSLGEINYSLRTPKNGLLVYVLEGRITVEDEITAEKEDTLFITGTAEISFIADRLCKLVLIETVMPE